MLPRDLTPTNHHFFYTPNIKERESTSRAYVLALHPNDCFLNLHELQQLYSSAVLPVLGHPFDR